jgi:hypothetical protein
MCVMTPIKSMKHKYELLLNCRNKMCECRNYKVNNVLPNRYVSTFILVENISMLMNLQLYFGMFSLSLNLFRVVVGKKLTYDPVIFH